MTQVLICERRNALWVLVLLTLCLIQYQAIHIHAVFTEYTVRPSDVVAVSNVSYGHRTRLAMVPDRYMLFGVTGLDPNEIPVAGHVLVYPITPIIMASVPVQILKQEGPHGTALTDFGATLSFSQDNKYLAIASLSSTELEYSSLTSYWCGSVFLYEEIDLGVGNGPFQLVQQFQYEPSLPVVCPDESETYFTLHQQYALGFGYKIQFAGNLLFVMAENVISYYELSLSGGTNSRVRLFRNLRARDFISETPEFKFRFINMLVDSNRVFLTVKVHGEPGSVYVLDREVESDAWNVARILKSPKASPFDEFGISMAHDIVSKRLAVCGYESTEAGRMLGNRGGHQRRRSELFGDGIHMHQRQATGIPSFYIYDNGSSQPQRLRDSSLSSGLTSSVSLIHNISVLEQGYPMPSLIIYVSRSANASTSPEQQQQQQQQQQRWLHMASVNLPFAFLRQDGTPVSLCGHIQVNQSLAACITNEETQTYYLLYTGNIYRQYHLTEAELWNSNSTTVPPNGTDPILPSSAPSSKQLEQEFVLKSSISSVCSVVLAFGLCVFGVRQMLKFSDRE